VGPYLVDRQGRKFALAIDGAIVIGREAGADLQVDDDSISRRHAFIAGANGAFSIADLNSSNGTYVNGRRVSSGSRIVLNNGDSVRLGGVDFAFHSDQNTRLCGTCSNCGSPVRIGARFCTKCGSPQAVSIAPSTYAPQHDPTLPSIEGTTGSKIPASRPDQGVSVRRFEGETLYSAPQVQYVATSSVNAGLAAILSFFWCGLGHIYVGQIGKGLLLMVLYPFCLGLGWFLLLFGGLGAAGSTSKDEAGVGLLVACLGLALLAIGAAVWLYGMINSYNVAKRQAVAVVSRAR
jgi:FHA domain/zinc-ribbon domain